MKTMVVQRRPGGIFLSWALVIVMLAGIFSFAPASAFADGDDVRAGGLQVEYRSSPLGLDAETPRFSWTLASEARGVTQTGYEIFVANSEANLAGGPYVWDSGDVAGDETFGVPYDGSPLQAETRYWWKVVSHTNKGDAEAVSWWETGLMNPDISAWDGADWLTKPADPPKPDLENYTVDWDFKMVDEGASLRFASDGGYYLVWQFNINARDTTLPGGGNGAPLFRPHSWNTGAACMDNISVSHVIPNTPEGKSAWYHCKIEVTKSGSSYYATTSLSPSGGALTVIDSNRTLPAGHEWTVGKLGFREINDNIRNEGKAYFDNIVVKDDQGAIVFNEAFEGDSSEMFGDRGVIENGTYHIDSAVSGTVDYEGYYRVVDGPPTGGDPLFRKGFHLTKEVKRARLYATARGYYEFSINGEKVGEDYLSPGWTDYNYTLMYQTYDVADMLKSGDNAIGGMISLGWYTSPYQRHAAPLYGDTQSLLGKLVIEYTDGSSETIVTDASWTYHAGPVLYADNYAGEYYDARYDCAGWNTAGYDDSGWAPAGIEGPLDTEVDIVSQIGEPIREVERFTNPVMTEPVEGRYTFDFGQNMAGAAALKIKGARGKKITVTYGEMLNTDVAYQMPGQSAVKGGDGPPGTVYRANQRDWFSLGRKVNIDTYTFKGDPAGESWMPRFTFHGFRYIEITGIDSAEDILEVEAIAFSSKNELTASFDSSNPKVNKLFDSAVWGMHSNFVSVPSSCPNRDEALGWTGDTQLFAGTAAYLANTDQFYSKHLRDLRDFQMRQTGENAGVVSEVVPVVQDSSKTSVDWASGWGDIAVILPWQVYQQYGDKQIVRDSFDSMKAWCDFLLNPQHTVNYIRSSSASTQNQDQNYGDWLSLETSDKSLVNTLYMAYDCRLFAEMARSIGETATADQYEETCRNIMDAVMDRWGAGNGTLSVSTQTPHAMILYFGLTEMTDKADSEAIAEKLMANVRDHGWKLTTGFFGVNALLPALTRYGQAAAAFRLLEQEEYPSWLYSINQGATTMWERWDSFTIENGFGDAGMNSFNHYIYGSVVEWMMSDLLGIRRDEGNPGFRHFILDPQYGGSLTHANGSYDSVSGAIEAGWSLNQETGAFAYEITVPANTTATVYLPTTDPAQVNEGGAPAASSEGVTLAGYDSTTEKAQFEVASGSYVFTSTVPEPAQYHQLNVTSPTLDVVGKITVEQGGKTIVGKTSVPISLNHNKALTIDVEPYNKQDFAQHPVLDKDNNPLFLPLDLPGFPEDTEWHTGYTWVGHTNILSAGVTVTTQTGAFDNATWGNANLVDGRLIARDGHYGWTSTEVGENPTTQPIIAFDAGSGKTLDFNRIHLYPRTDVLTAAGGSANFPRDFTIEISDDNATWTPVKTLTDVQAPFFSPYIINFDTVQSARYLRLVCTRTGTYAGDEPGRYRMQLTEFGAYNVGELAIETEDFPPVEVGKECTLTLESEEPGAAWAIVSGRLPDGLFLDPAAGVIYGRPEETGDFTFEVKGSTATSEALKTLIISVLADRAPIIALEGIALSPGHLSLKEGDKGQFAVSFFPVNTTDPKTVSYSVVPQGVVSVGTDGSYTALKSGNAVVTATSADGKHKAFSTVVVSAKEGDKLTTPGDPVQSLSVTPGTVKLAFGGTVKLAASVAPTTAAPDNPVTWTSSDPLVAAVSADGTVSGVGEGTAKITATAGGKSASCDVTVMKPVTKLRTALSKVLLKANAKATLPVVAYDKNGAVTALLSWTSGKPTVAAVDAKTGKITARKAGTAKITATALNGKKLTVTVKVVKKAKAIGKIALVKPPKTMKKGAAAQLKLKVTPASATYKTIVFRSSKPGVVSIDKAGTLTAKKKGKATITVKMGTRTVRYALTVK